jgi:hypothetical protein
MAYHGISTNQFYTALKHVDKGTTPPPFTEMNFWSILGSNKICAQPHWAASAWN